MATPRECLRASTKKAVLASIKAHERFLEGELETFTHVLSDPAEKNRLQQQLREVSRLVGDVERIREC